MACLAHQLRYQDTVSLRAIIEHAFEYRTKSPTYVSSVIWLTSDTTWSREYAKLALIVRHDSLPCIPGVGRARRQRRAGEGIVSYQQPPDREWDTAAGLSPGGYQDQDEQALSRWYGAQPDQQTQPPPGRPEPQLGYPPQSYAQQPARNPYDHYDPGQWQQPPPWQDHIYQAQRLT